MKAFEIQDKIHRNSKIQLRNSKIIKTLNFEYFHFDLQNLDFVIGFRIFYFLKTWFE